MCSQIILANSSLRPGNRNFGKKNVTGLDSTINLFKEKRPPHMDVSFCFKEDY